jgi:hypothetical protein
VVANAKLSRANTFEVSSSAIVVWKLVVPVKKVRHD